MTSRIRVPIWGLNKSVMIPSDATKGAQIGLDLLMPDGSQVTAAKLAAYIGVVPTPPNASPNILTTPVLWSRILGIPNNVLQPPFSDDSAAPGVDGDAIPGPRGLQGVPGIGIPGDDGYMGSDGDAGPPGAAGAASTVPGPQGPPGAPIPADDGRDGYDGDPVPGPQGLQGAQGSAGATGVAGPPGDDGFIGMDGDSIPGPVNFAAPSALVGLAAIAGVSNYAKRSDAASALDVTISPTWTGVHTFVHGSVPLIVGGVGGFAEYLRSLGTIASGAQFQTWYDSTNTTRRGYLGFPSTGNADIEWKNEVATGNLKLTPAAGALIVANGIIKATAGNEGFNDTYIYSMAGGF